MLELEQIMAAWKFHAEAAPVTKHPTVWVAHYGTSERALIERIMNGPIERELEMLGALASTEPNSIGNAILFLGAPWTTVAEVHECAVVVDVFRELHVTHFVDEGKVERSTDWRLRYDMADDGTLQFGCAEKRPSAFWSELNLLWESRISGKGKHDFHQAFLSALRLGEALL